MSLTGQEVTVSAINPNQPFVRVQIDLPTPVALAFDEIATASGKTKKAYLAEIIMSEVERVNAPHKGGRAKKK